MSTGRWYVGAPAQPICAVRGLRIGSPKRSLNRRSIALCRFVSSLVGLQRANVKTCSPPLGEVSEMRTRTLPPNAECIRCPAPTVFHIGRAATPSAALTPPDSHLVVIDSLPVQRG